MKNIQLLLNLIILHKVQSNASCEIIYQYECGNKFNRYNLDNEPAEYGISAGQYALGKEAYIGLSIYAEETYIITQLQLNPPGVIVYDTAGTSSFTNDTNKIWFLVNDKNHEYTWVDSQNAEIPPFAIDVGKDRNRTSKMIGRIKKPNGFVAIGFVIPILKLMFYVDENNITKSTASGYQVLTCKSSIQSETKYLTPNYEFPPNKDTGCINNWQPYKNDDAPALNGIAAGEYDCNNTAYVGKGKDFSRTIPGRIQISPQSGLILTNYGKSKLITNGSFYLVDNSNYTYYWTPFVGISLPNNTVYARNDSGASKYGVGRVKVNGHTQIGKIYIPALIAPNDEGIETYYYDYEILVCDPWPKYQCAQQWKKLNANDSNLLVDGFNIDSTSFIGRSVANYINECDYGLGKIQTGSNGVNYLDELTANSVFDNSSNVEYLVKNSSYTYKWQPSISGMKVVNALELHKEGHRPFYIGITRINGNVVIGKVRPGEGLFFIDPITGRQQSTSSYEVLTCISSDASNGVYEEESDEDWYTAHWCPAGKKWSFEKSKCVLI